MKYRLLSLICALLTLASCQTKAPRAKHVIYLGFDAMSAVGIQRAETPNFNYLIENGAVSLHTRCVRETSSSQNWMSMVSGAPIEIHGVFSNKWKPDDPERMKPALENALGFFPTVFDDIRARRPDLRQYAFIEWQGETRMYDMSAFDKSYVMHVDTTLHSYKDVITKAFDVYLEERPELLFLSLDITDHMGHTFGHESEEYLSTITEMDAYVGDFVRELEKRGWMDDTVVIISADHGGANFGHGGDSIEEFEIPIILYGKGVTRGKVLKRTSMIYDLGATMAGLLGVELPWECRGKMLDEAFTPKEDESVYVPVPMVHPFKGRVTGDITITDDVDGAEVYYTLDGTEPDENSIHYEGPFRIDHPAHIRSVAIRNGCRSTVAENYLYTSGKEPAVRYKLYTNTTEKTMPDFTKYGKPTAEGYVFSFALDEFNMGSADWFSVLMTSNLVVEEEADYTFEVRADDGACMYVDGNLVVSNPNAHSIAKPVTGKVHLTKGLHLVKVEYYEVTSTQGLYIRYSINDGPLNPLFLAQFER